MLGSIQFNWESMDSRLLHSTGQRSDPKKEEGEVTTTPEESATLSDLDTETSSGG